MIGMLLSEVFTSGFIDLYICGPSTSGKRQTRDTKYICVDKTGASGRRRYRTYAEHQVYGL